MRAEKSLTEFRPKVNRAPFVVIMRLLYTVSFSAFQPFAHTIVLFSSMTYKSPISVVLRTPWEPPPRFLRQPHDSGIHFPY